MFGFLAQLLNWCYSIWPNYLGMIIIFTLILMVVITPFTVKGMRSAAEMSRLQPEIKKIQDANKNDRIKQNEEMQALFKEHGVNPLGGCLPTLLPLPIFFIVFRLLERLNGHKTGAAAPLVRLVRGQVGGPGGYVAPHYLAYHDKLTQSIINHNGVLKAFGMDLAAKARDHHSSVGAAIPFYVLIIVMTASQYWQQRQINQRNPAAANANPQMKMTMQLFPAFYAIISLNIPAAVVFYLLISGLFRMGQNSISYRYDPVLKNAMQPLPAGAGAAIEAKSSPKSPPPLPSAKAGGAGTAAKAGGGGTAKPGGRSTSAKPAAPAGPPAKQGGFMERLRAQAAEAKAQAEKAQQERAAAKGQGAAGAAAQGRSGTAGRGATNSGRPGSGGKSGSGRAQGRPGNASGAGAGRGASSGNGAGGRAQQPQPADRTKPQDAPAPSVEEQIVAEEAIDAAINAAGAGEASSPAADEVLAEDQMGAGEDAAASAEVPAGADGGNGSPASKSSPLRVTRPSGRPATRGKKPRPGQ